LLGAGHLLLLFFTCGFGGYGSLAWALQSTITPPPILFWLAANDSEMQRMEYEMGFIFAMFGLMGWAVAAAVLWNVTRTRFRRLTSRMARRRPEVLALSGTEFDRLYRPRRP
jgi:hypothetical protein